MSNVIQQPRFDPKELVDLYQRQSYERLSVSFLEILGHFERQTYYSLDAQAQYFIDVFVKNFLYLFTQPDYVLTDQHAVRFIELNLAISNLVAMSGFKNTDAYLQVLLLQPRNFAKLLALYSARNTVRFDYKMLFDTNPQLTALWYSYYMEAYRSGLVNPTAQKNLREHLVCDDERLNDFYNFSDVYFGATYIDPDRDKGVKRRLNHSLQKGPAGQGAFIQNKPKKNQVAVFSSLWFPGHSVYRTLAEYVDALRPDYELTYVHLGGLRNNLNIGPYTKIKYVSAENGVVNIDAIRQNDFALVFYPDIGMSPESIVLSNLRLAPIQLCGTGHPVSTAGSEIDYFVTGKNVEFLEGYEENYSERLLVLPGFGAVHQPPTYELRHPQKTTSKFVVNCTWYAQKVNYTLLQLVKQIIERSEKDVVFRLFVGGALDRKNDFIPFARDVEAYLGREHVEIVPGKAYDDYMAHMEEGDIAIESHHFGGSNVMSDCLHIRKPTVTLEGRKWYNRIGSAMARAAGLEELIACTPQEYVDKTVRLINDDTFRQKIEQKVLKADLLGTVFAKVDGMSFKRAVDYLVENHEKLKAEGQRTPIVID